MDPNAALDELIGLATSDLREFGDEVHRLAELVLALDDWLARGGFLPTRWNAGRSAAEEGGE